MNVKEAYAKLRTLLPDRSFCIGLEVWHHEHSVVGEPYTDISWSIYDNKEGTHVYGPTLDSVMSKFQEGTFSEVDQSVSTLPIETLPVERIPDE